MKKDREINAQFVNAIKNKNIALLDYLLKSSMDELYLTEGIKKALEIESNEVIKCFIDNECIDAKEVYFFAIITKSINVINYLVSLGLDVNVENGVGLVSALDVKDFELIKCLVKNKINVDAYEKYAIKYAIRTSDIELMNFLIENGASIEDKNDPLIRIAATNGNKEIVSRLIDAGCELEISKFLSSGHIDLLKELTINGKCDPYFLMQQAQIHKNEHLRSWSEKYIKIEDIKSLKEKLDNDLSKKNSNNTIKNKV